MFQQSYTNIMTHCLQDIRVLLECILHERINSMLTSYSIPLYNIVIHVTQDLLRNQVINPITQESHMILDLCLEYQ